MPSTRWAYWARSRPCWTWRGLRAHRRRRDCREWATTPPASRSTPPVLTALFRRERTGRGGLAHTSLLANGFWSNGCFGAAALAGVDFSERRTLAPDASRPMAPMFVLYEAADGGYLQLNMVRTDAQIEALLRVVGLEHLLDDPRFATVDDRFENGFELVQRLRPIFASRPLAEWLSVLREAGVPASKMYQVEEMARDGQARANRVLMDARDEGVGMDWVINHPVGLDSAGRGPERPPEIGRAQRGSAEGARLHRGGGRAAASRRSAVGEAGARPSTRSRRRSG